MELPQDLERFVVKRRKVYSSCKEFERVDAKTERISTKKLVYPLRRAISGKTELGIYFDEALVFYQYFEKKLLGSILYEC